MPATSIAFPNCEGIYFLHITTSKHNFHKLALGHDETSPFDPSWLPAIRCPGEDPCQIFKKLLCFAPQYLLNTLLTEVALSKTNSVTILVMRVIWLRSHKEGISTFSKTVSPSAQENTHLHGPSMWESRETKQSFLRPVRTIRVESPAIVKQLPHTLSS